MKRRLRTEEFTITFVLQSLKFLQPVFRLGRSSESSHGGLAITSLRLRLLIPLATGFVGFVISLIWLVLF
ncbi:hypothetical protein [Nostoc sp. UHCC 0302]|uniref:hypothetical protein n=1 Tax=Nostoc sp. UHCC 0302 TaxID=3134896 RepID=UPI00311C8BC1